MMQKHKTLLLICVLAAISLGGCTSKKAAEEQTETEAAELTGESAGGDVAASEGGEATVDDLGGDELSPDEQLSDDTGGDLSAQEAAPTEDPNAAPSDLPPDQAANEPPPDALAEKPLEEAGPTPEPTAPTDPTAEPAPVEDPMAMGTTEEAPPVEEKKVLPLRKIADMPYEQGGVLVNTVYLARKGDTLEGISNKIYGNNSKIKELVKLNPTFKNRDVKVGDKVYYNSPQRPTDSSKLLTYYEDMGLAPQTYVANKPENLREVAKTLLGDKNSWKEIWSTNLDLDSKDQLAEGTQFKYWADVAAAPTEPVMDQAALSPPPPPPESTEIAPPPPTDTLPQSAEIPPPPPVDSQAAMTPPPVEAAPPPPAPEPQAEVPPPPPPPSAEAEAPAASALGELGNPDQTMAMAAGAVLLLGAVALFIMIRKRKARRQMDFHTSTQTQIE